jgi:hypothetical protein
MITIEIQELFDDLKRELVAIKTDLIIMKYTMEQIESKLDTVNLPNDNQDPFANRTVYKL